MLRRGRGSKPTKVQGNIDKFKNNFHIGSSPGRKSKIQTHHAGTIHLDSSDSSSGVVQPKEGKEETTSSQSSQPTESGSREGKTMVDHKDHEIYYSKGKLKIQPHHPVQNLELMNVVT